MKNLYRVECNFGSKYFTEPLKAFNYFHRQFENGFSVEIYLRQVVCTKKLFSVTETLLDILTDKHDKAEYKRLLEKYRQ